jgi:hypothetical protein
MLEKRVLLSNILVSDFGARPSDGQDDRGGIQAAVNAANSGDTIFFADGSYNVSGQVSLKSGVNYTAVHPGGALLEFSVPVNGGDVNGDNYAFNCSGLRDVAFTDLKVRSNNGIFFLENTGNLRFTGNDFQWGYAGNYYNRLVFYGGGSQDGLRIDQNYFHDSPNSDRNVEIWGMRNSSYSYNRFHNVHDGGHIMEPESNVQLSFNRGTRIHRMGMEIQGHNPTIGLVVEGNVFSDWDRPWNDTFGISVMMMNSPDTRIINNYLSADFSGDWGVSSPDAGGPRFGIAIEAGLGGGEVSGNVIGGPYKWVAGVTCSQSNTLVRNNEFYGSAEWGDITAEPGNRGVGSFVDRDNARLAREQMPAPPQITAAPMGGGDDSSSPTPTPTSPVPAAPAPTPTPAPAPQPPPTVPNYVPVVDDSNYMYVTDYGWMRSENGLGPVEVNFSNGGGDQGDGTPMSLNGNKYEKGLGVAGDSAVTYHLNKQFAKFACDVGVDDESGSKGRLRFQVFADGKLIFDSGDLTGKSSAKHIEVDTKRVNELKLVTIDGGNGAAKDHGDWAGARLIFDPNAPALLGEGT